MTDITDRAYVSLLIMSVNCFADKNNDLPLNNVMFSDPQEVAVVTSRPQNECAGLCNLLMTGPQHTFLNTLKTPINEKGKITK